MTERWYPVSRSAQLHHSQLSQNSSGVSEVGLLLVGSMALMWKWGSSYSASRYRPRRTWSLPASPIGQLANPDDGY
ncbi:MAG: hypothetical protein QJR12_10530 [Mycobacterium sp.]|uniref:hypothetical protein n=1 Tax=Mycobacterium sp. TaxID=1785 RepID=UPI002624690E|nr:hypothetical protein [Mycobacterium sp.]MDI3314681.1 hypothetical protein [Mycobacterium sp.]